MNRQLLWPSPTWMTRLPHSAALPPPRPLQKTPPLVPPNGQQPVQPQSLYRCEKATLADTDFSSVSRCGSPALPATHLQPQSNTGDAPYSLNGSTGAVTGPDFETKASYSFTVVATDATASTGAVTLDDTAPSIPSPALQKTSRWSSGLYRSSRYSHLQPQSQHRRRFRFQHQQQHRRVTLQRTLKPSPATALP